MPKYVNADKLISELRYDLENDPCIYNYRIAKEVHDEKLIYAIELLNDAPAEDVEPIKYGKWFHTFDNRYKCGVCHEKCEYDTPYCPECGARLKPSYSRSSILD